MTLLWRFKIRDFTLSSLFEGDINLQIKHVVTFELISEVERNATNLLKRETFANQSNIEKRNNPKWDKYD